MAVNSLMTEEVIHSSMSHGEFIKFSVSDSGIGIKAENIPKLFKPFGMLQETAHINKSGNLYIIIILIR